ncbi:MAG: glutamine synthetase beta-grasp domain-containing protein [Acidimicrobiales bacterium]
MEERTPAEVVELAAEEGVEIVDVRFCDLPGLMQHFSVPVSELTEDVFEEGFGFDGSSIRGFQEIQESDMILLPDPNTAYIDPFRKHKTLNLHMWVHDPITGEPYSRDPRYVARKAEEHLRSTGIADTCFVGPEAEFFIFDDVRFAQDAHSAFYAVDSVEASWNTARDEHPNLGYKPRYKEGYFPVPPMDHHQDLRSEMTLILQSLGIPVEVQHHEVGTAGQAEIDIRFDSLLRQADQLMTFKYVIKQTAWQHGKTVTFMPKPVFQDNGSGMHTHLSLWKAGEPLFYDESGYAGLSDLKRWFRARRSAGARSGGAGVHQPDDELVQAAGARIRGAGEPRLQPAQSIRGGAHPAVLAVAQGQAHRVPLPRPVGEPVPGVLGVADGGPRRHRRSHRTADARRPQRDLYDLPPEELAAVPRVPASLEDVLHGDARGGQRLLSRRAASSRTTASSRRGSPEAPQQGSTNFACAPTLGVPPLLRHLGRGLGGSAGQNWISGL